MTRTKNSGKASLPGKAAWALQDAKARFSELVRKAKTEGPQHVTVHGREEVVVVSVEDYRRAQDRRTGQELVDIMRDSPLRDVEFERTGTRSEVRGIDL